MSRTALLAAVAVSAAVSVSAGEDVRHLLNRSVWIDIGPGRKLEQLSAREIATLKTCKQASMGFQTTAHGLAQTFYAGISLHTEYDSVSTQTDATGTAIQLFLRDSRRAAETLHLSKDRSVLVQQTPGFRPHTYLECVFPPENDKHKR